MPEENLLRMIRLADEFFGARRDPSQISVTRSEMARLQKIHPSTMNERRTAKGPVAWVLVLPTTRVLMEQFIHKKISERALLRKTPLHAPYDTIYLSSALVLPEFRRKGYAQRLLIKAIRSIQKTHPITTLFYWGFSSSGKKLAHSVAAELKLPLLKRNA
jgi:hypothetical protein